MTRKVQIATFHELVSQKSGEVYLKAAFGPVDLLLFKDLAHPILGKDGTRTYPWNLVLCQNWEGLRGGRPLTGLGEQVDEEKLPE